MANALLDFLQAASNAAASNVSGPVDLLGIGLRKVGVPVPENALLSSQWMREKGLMRDVPQGAAQVAGETFGLLSPVVVAAKAPQVARGLLQMGENAAAPRTIGKFGQRGAVKYPQAEALEEARKNAVKMLGLPENNTPMDRARAMGFDGYLYHGGTNDFPSFKVSSRSSVYASDDPKIADIYANATGRHAALREINASPNTIKLMHRGKLIEVSDQGNGGGGWLYDNLAQKLGTEYKRGLVKDLPSHGYSGLKATQMDDLGGRQTQYVFPDPSVLRSKFAAFDPAKIDSADLLAGLASMGLLSPWLLDQPAD